VGLLLSELPLFCRRIQLNLRGRIEKSVANPGSFINSKGGEGRTHVPHRRSQKRVDRLDSNQEVTPDAFDERWEGNWP